MKYRVRALGKAQQDVDAILTWLLEARKTPRGAAAWLRAYENAVASLANFPERHSFAPENTRLILSFGRDWNTASSIA